MTRWPAVDRRTSVFWAAAAGCVGAIGLVLSRWPAEDWRHWLPDLLVGLAFLISGALIAMRPDGGPEGVLVAAVGAAWFVADIVPALAVLHRGLLIHAAVAMPRGTVSTRLSRAVVLAGYASVFLSLWAASPLVPLGLAVGLLMVARGYTGPRHSACLLVAALLVTVSLAQYAAGASVAGAVLLLYEAGLIVVAAGLAAIFMRGTRRSDVMDLVVEMGPQDALADLARRDPMMLEDPALQAAVVAAERVRGANAQLTRRLEEQIAAVDASRRRLLAAQDEERVTLEDRLRHGPAGRLDKVAAELAGLTSQEPVAAERLVVANAQVSAARADLSRISRGLYPDAIADGSLESALHVIAGNCPIPVDVDLGVTRVGPAAAAIVYYVCSEAVANAARHAGATRVSLLVHAGRSGDLAVQVTDDGIGGARLDGGSGLQGLADRVGAAGGSFTISSASSGTTIEARIPALTADA